MIADRDWSTIDRRLYSFLTVRYINPNNFNSRFLLLSHLVPSCVPTGCLSPSALHQSIRSRTLCGRRDPHFPSLFLCAFPQSSPALVVDIQCRSTVHPPRLWTLHRPHLPARGPIYDAALSGWRTSLRRRGSSSKAPPPTGSMPAPFPVDSPISKSGFPHF